LEAKGIHVLSDGEIENYYPKTWLYQILRDEITDSDLPNARKAEVITLVDNFTNPTDIGTLKMQVGTTLGFTPDEQVFISKILNCKEGLIQANMDEAKISKKLESILGSLDLTKPKIAIRISQFASVNDLLPARKTEFQTLFHKVFM